MSLVVALLVMLLVLIIIKMIVRELPLPAGVQTIILLVVAVVFLWKLLGILGLT